MRIKKRLIGSGQSYPLRVSFLEKALVIGELDLDTELVQGGGSVVFEAFFWPPNSNISFERLYIRTRAVSSLDVKAIRDLLEVEGIPNFILWVRYIISLPMDSPIRRGEQYFKWE